jgi:hypothetical protein
MAGLADIFSGGEDSAAADVLQKQLDKTNAIPTPTAGQLTLPQLQQFVQAGIMTPEEAKAYLVDSNALDTVGAGGAGMDTELETIGKLRDIVNSGGADAEEQSAIQSILNTLGTTERGANEAIVNQNARQGIANSGLTMAAKLEAEQNAATNANANALQTGASEEARNLAALTQLGGLGGQVQGQEYTAGANRANAANAIAEFNAQQNQDIAKVNATAGNAAKAANLANAQDISNKNTVTAQTQQESIPAAQQQAFDDALKKAGVGMQGAESLANVKETTGQQNAGTLGGLIGTAGTIGAAYLAGNPYAALATTLAKTQTPNTNVSTTSNAATGGRVVEAGVEHPLNMESGGPVPGRAVVPGDSPANDRVRADLSPNEIVLPRSVSIPAMQGDTSKVLDFLRSLPKPQARQSIHPKAVLDTLRGLSLHHQGAI